MRTVLYPGSFDPVTVGHADLISRAAMMFDRVIVGVLHNPQKPSGAFPVEVRIALLRETTAMYANVTVAAYSGLLVDVVQTCGADVVMRGIRTSADTETELQMARINRQLRGVETLFLAASAQTAHISASYVREIGRLGGDLRNLVPDAVHRQIADTLRNHCQ